MTSQVSKLLLYINHDKLVKEEPVATNSIKDLDIKNISLGRVGGG